MSGKLNANVRGSWSAVPRTALKSVAISTVSPVAELHPRRPPRPDG